MSFRNFDVVIVGAGAAGLTAAIGLARAGFSVALVEAAPFPGAENWSGCVYFSENLAHPDILGPEGALALAWERRLVERGLFATDGYGLLGLTYRDAAAFRHCYTALRPVFDHHLGQVASGLGVALLTGTTAESLIRAEGCVIGVATNRGPLYADLVFLAEGDASHLVAREGYERSSDPRYAPKFLLGIKQVIDFPPGMIEKTFDVGPEEGVAYELLLRNGTRHGHTVPLNLRGFVCTNRRSLSVGLILPLDNLTNHFEDDPGVLLEWFGNLPALGPWFSAGTRGIFGAKLIRGGGARDIPHLIDNGLAIGGAASAIGVDFPYLNFIGPATRMGLLLAQAARRIRAESVGFTRDALHRHYLEHLRQTHHWKDVEFLRRWPGYVRKTQVFFSRDLDLVLGSAHVWTRPGQWFLTAWTRWLGMVRQLADPSYWPELQEDFRRLRRALRTREVAGRPALGRLLLDGALNSLRDLLQQPRANLGPTGTLRLHYTVAGGAQATGLPPAFLRRWFRRFAPVLASAARQIYVNDERPIALKLQSAVHILVRQFNLFDVLAAVVVGIVAGLYSVLLAGGHGFWRLLRGNAQRPRAGLDPHYALAARQTSDLTSVAHWAPPGGALVARLAPDGTKVAPINVLWPKSLAVKNVVGSSRLWHVCPTRVYEAHVGPLGQLQVRVHAEKCIQCHACWRTSDLVDWNQGSAPHFIYAVRSPVVSRLLDAQDAVAGTLPVHGHGIDPWDSALGFKVSLPNCESDPDAEELSRLLAMLERKLEEFRDALAQEPHTIDRSRSDYLEMLARYAQQLGVRVLEIVRRDRGTSPATPRANAVQTLAGSLVAKLEQRARRTWDQRFAWAAADGREVSAHHVVGLRRLLSLVQNPPSAATVRGTEHSPAFDLADRLCRRALAHALTEVRFPGLFEDDEGRDPISKFGAIKQKVAEMAARRYLIETLDRLLSSEDSSPRSASDAVLAKAVIAEVLGATPGNLAWAAAQILASTDDPGHDERGILDQDDAVRCSLGVSPTDVYRRRGEALLDAWQFDGSRLAALPGETPVFDEIAQRQALSGALEEVNRLQSGLQQWINEWRAISGQHTGPGGGIENLARRSEIAEQLGRQDALLLASKAMLLQTHAGLENGSNSELEVVLLAVWLGEVGRALEELAESVRRQRDAQGWREDRPVVEPDTEPPLQTYADYLTARCPYESGDFLVHPVELVQPRLVPEMGQSDLTPKQGRVLLPGRFGRPSNDLPYERLMERELWTRGPVNPLDPLNVRRAVLSIAALAQLTALYEEGRAASETGNPTADGSAWRLGYLDEDCFLAESLVWELAGRLEHTQTKSLQLEAAITKLLVSEWVYRAVETVEKLCRQAGLPMAKRERDGRLFVLDEGTNDLQRLLILRELATNVAVRWSRQPGPALPRHLGREALEVEALRVGVRQRVEAGLGVFGQDVWQNPNLQPACFLLAEAAAWLKAADSVVSRLAWLSRQSTVEEESEPGPKVQLARRALRRCAGEVRNRWQRFDEELIHLRRGYYAPEVRAASLLFRRTSVPPPAEEPKTRIDRPLAVLILVQTTAGVRPKRQRGEDQLLDSYVSWTPGDRAALETALRLRDQATASVRVEVAAVGRSGMAGVLREALSLGVDAVRLLIPEEPATTADAIQALAEVWKPLGPFDLILAGADAPDGQPRVTVRLLADALGVPLAGDASRVGVWTDRGQNHITLIDASNGSCVHSLPAAAALHPGLPLRPFHISGYLTGLAKPIDFLTWPTDRVSKPRPSGNGAAAAP
jgi:flavin-dependent dehydrogenase